MSEVVKDRKRAIMYTVIYAVFLLLSLIGLITRHTRRGRGLMLLITVWAIGGVLANWRAIPSGFVDLDENSNLT